jgi:hypothetical protein
MLKFYS